MGAEVDVQGAQRFVSRIGAEEIRNGVDEFRQNLGSRMFVTFRRQGGVHSEAEGGQFAFVVQKASGHVVIAGHVLGDVVPIMVAHGLETVSERPFRRRLHLVLGQRDLDAVHNWIGTLLQVQTSTSAISFQLSLRTTHRADGGRIDEISGHRPIIAIIDVVKILRKRRRCVFGFGHRSLNTGDDTVLVEQ